MSASQHMRHQLRKWNERMQLPWFLRKKHTNQTLREFEKSNFEIGSKKRLKLSRTSVSRISKDRGFLKLHSSTVPSPVTKLMLTFLHGDGSSKLHTVHDVNVPLTDLNLSVVQMCADVITASFSAEAVYRAAECQRSVNMNR